MLTMLLEQLQKMGILQTEKEPKPAPSSAKRKTGIDFSALGPLNNAAGTKNFAGYRDPSAASPSTRKSKSGKKGDEDTMDSDADDDDEDGTVPVDADVEVKESDGRLLSPEDARRQGELAEGVRKIKVSAFFQISTA